jgi:hypothetical protein
MTLNPPYGLAPGRAALQPHEDSQGKPEITLDAQPVLKGGNDGAQLTAQQRQQCLMRVDRDYGLSTVILCESDHTGGLDLQNPGGGVRDLQSKFP